MWGPQSLHLLLGFGLSGQTGFEAACVGEGMCPCVPAPAASQLRDGSDALVPRAQPDTGRGFLPAVPTDALANKLFGVPEPSTIARSLPTTVPESPNYRNARTPRTPRTPQLKDPTQTPRFYPVVKEGRTIDAKVGPGWAGGRELGSVRWGLGRKGTHL